MMYANYIGAILLAIASYASAHSWVACTDYRGDINYYQNNRCYGYVRNWKRARGIVPEALQPDPKGYNIGVDTGYQYNPTENAACQFPMANPPYAAYTSDYPMAVYEKGGVYCLAWPTKNHAAATCTNQYIPDRQLHLYISNVNPTKDPTQSAFKLRNINGFKKCQGSNANSAECTLGKSKHVNGAIDCEGFQRAPTFCEYTDKALAHACFEIPSWLPKGRYAFQWLWEFNAGEFYSTCWDAKVVPAGKSPARPVKPGTKGIAKNTLCQGGFSGPGDCKCTNNYHKISGLSLRGQAEESPVVDVVESSEGMEVNQMENETDYDLLLFQDEAEAEAEAEHEVVEVTGIRVPGHEDEYASEEAEIVDNVADVQDSEAAEHELVEEQA